MSRSNLSRETKGEKSCGCLKTKHGLWQTRSYEVWSSMVKRCTRKSSRNYHRYGGRGITVCERWLDFENFYADMGERPEGLTLERIDNEKGYYPENCKWATVAEQNRNRKNNVNITIDGVTKCAKDWGDMARVNMSVITGRVRKGWDGAQAVFTPVKTGSLMVTINGVEKAVADVAKEYGLDESCLRARLRRGWDIQRAVEPPKWLRRSA